MKTSETTKEIYKALYNIEHELSPIIKDKVNTYTNSKYTDINSVLDLIKEPFYNNGLLLKQTPEGNGGMTTRIIHLESEEYIESSFNIELGEKYNPQNAGAAITYQRRYAIICMLNLQLLNDNDGNMNNQKSRSQKEAENALKKTEKDLLEVIDNDKFYYRLYELEKASNDILWNTTDCLTPYYNATKKTFDKVSENYIQYKINHNLH